MAKRKLPLYRKTASTEWLPVRLFSFIAVVIVGCLGLTACGEKNETMWAGLNARVVEIDAEQMILYVEDCDDSAGVFGRRCALECRQAAEEYKLLFVDYETSELTEISFAEFQLGDELIIYMYDSQKQGAKDASAVVEQVQLGTQRPLQTVLGASGEVLLIDYFQQYYDRVYFRREEPAEPQEGDFCIDSAHFLGSELTFETTGDAFLVQGSLYAARALNAEPVAAWYPVEQDSYLVLGRDMDGELYEVRGERHEIGHSVSRMILEESYGVMDWEVALRHDANPYPQRLGVGQWDEMSLSLVREEPAIERLEDWDPVYGEGDFWERYTLDGLSILRYYNSREDRYGVFTVELTRNDFQTQRGIRVGDTREAVKAAYPELKSGDYWGKYPDEDCLWYCEDELDFGPALIFFFEADKVSKIILNDMFN